MPGSAAGKMDEVPAFATFDTRPFACAMDEQEADALIRSVTRIAAALGMDTSVVRVDSERDITEVLVGQRCLAIVYPKRLAGVIADFQPCDVTDAERLLSAMDGFDPDRRVVVLDDDIEAAICAASNKRKAEQGAGAQAASEDLAASLTCSECGLTCASKESLQRHINGVHRKIRNHACEAEGCGKRFTTLYDLRRHVSAVHDKNARFECCHCHQRFTFGANLRRHIKAQHENAMERVPCSREDCSDTFSTKANMEAHVLHVHQDQRDYQCDDCDRAFHTPKLLRQHCIYAHGDERAHACNACDQTFKTKGHLDRHVADVHDNIRNVPCKDDTCPSRFTSNSHMNDHYDRVHNQRRDVKCIAEECDAMFYSKGDMERHHRCLHTKEGMQKHIRKQARVRELLETVYTVDSERHIQYARGCVPDPDKFCARADFHIVGITHIITIVECDEDGHRSYLLPCELTRMEQIHEAILKAQFEDVELSLGEEAARLATLRPVLFVRYNPDSCTVNGTKVKRTREEKSESLMKFLDDVQRGERVYDETLNIVYINYDMEDGMPVVYNDPDFPAQMRGCVRLL